MFLQVSATFLLVSFTIPQIIPQLNSPNCGLTGPELPPLNSRINFPFIVAGENEFGWRAWLQFPRFRKPHWCAASILSASWAITAAHCVVNMTDAENYPPAFFTFIAGVYDIDDVSERGRITRKLKATFPFPSFNPLLSNTFDIALLELESPLPMYDYGLNLSSICLPEGNSQDLDQLIGRKCIAIGWIRPDGSKICPFKFKFSLFNMHHSPSLDMIDQKENLLVKVPQSIILQSTCTEAYSKVNQTIFKQMICTSGPNTCDFYSGSPLICLNPSTHRWTLEGILTNIFTTNCEPTQLPNVHTRVAFFVKWAHETIQSHTAAPTSTLATLTTPESSGTLLLLDTEENQEAGDYKLMY